ncbi:MAG TPA: hypothetical protein VE404_09275, partial [Verrucomicrobiae bacterium]|nr:hypothetical protein [Verrucomicrobiae bacterium]
MSPTRSTSSFDALQDIWSRRKWPAIVSLAATLTAALAVAVALPDIYRSTATVLVRREHVAETIVKPSVTGELEARLRTIGQEILSRARLLDLIDRYRLFPQSKVASAPEALVERMRREIHLETREADPGAARGETIAFAISFQGTDPAKVADVTNALASFYVEENMKAREGQTAGTAEFLRTQLEPMKARLDEQAVRLNDFKMRHIGALPQQVGANLATLERLNSQLQQNRDQQSRIFERLDGGDRRTAGEESGGAAPGSESPDVRVIRLEHQLAALRARYSDSYPDVVQIRAELAALARARTAAGAAPRPSRAGAARSAPSGPAPELDALKAEEKRLQDQIGAYQSRVDGTPGTEQELAALTRDYET